MTQLNSEKNYWKIEITNAAKKQLKRIDKKDVLILLDYIDYLATQKDIFKHCKQLKGSLAGLYRFRKGEYRIVAQIKDSDILITVASIGSRQGIYKD